jgi:type II secretion system protein G
MKRVATVLAKVVLCCLAVILICDVAIVNWPAYDKGPHVKRDLARTQIVTLSFELEMYDVHIGHYPTEEEDGLKALLVKPCYADPDLGDKWKGPYINEDRLKDPWNETIHYRLTPPGTPGAEEVPFKLWSSGPDRKDGTDDDIKWDDRQNW